MSGPAAEDDSNQISKKVTKLSNMNMPVAAVTNRRAAFSLLLRAAAPDQPILRWAVLGLLLASALEALGPLLGKAFIDHYLPPHPAQLGTMAGLLGGALVAGCAATWLRYFQLRRLAGVAMRAVRRIRQSVFGHVLRLPMAFFDRALTGVLVSRVTNDTEAVKGLYMQVLFTLLDACAVLLGLLLTMAWLDWRLMGIVALLLPAVWAIVAVYQRLSAPAVARARELRGEINAQTAESIAGMAVLRASGAHGRFLQRFREVNARHYAARQQELRANAWLLRPALDFLNVGILAAVMVVVGLRGDSAAQAVQVGLLYAFVSYISRVVEPLIQITMQFSQLQQSIIAAARVNTLLDEAQAPQATSDAHITRGAISAHALSFGYAAGHDVLHQIDLDLAAGGYYGVVGQTGAGKTTLLALLLRHYIAAPGMLRIDGQDLSKFGDNDFRAAVGLVPQEPFMLAASVRENIDMGRGLPQQRLAQAASDAHALPFIEQLEQTWDTPLGEGGARLSVGQKQLIAIARALAGQPRILLLDEATAHIDSQTEAEVQRALGALRGRVTVLAIAHRLSTIRQADQILVLHHGRLVELGHHDALMSLQQGRYRRLVMLQQLQAQESRDAEQAAS